MRKLSAWYKYLFILFLMAISNIAYSSQTCTYHTYSWNTQLKKPNEVKIIKKPYVLLTQNEIDSFTGCTVCEEDQRKIHLPPLKPFKLCHIIADKTLDVLNGLIEQGEPVLSVVGYRVGKTRGDPDNKGNRTKFSNHSYGIALDINTEQNGLYDNCIVFNQKCRLLRGGRWQPQQYGALLKDSIIVKALKDIGFKWGGEIKGKQKDFMHFSPTGY